MKSIRTLFPLVVGAAAFLSGCDTVDSSPKSLDPMSSDGAARLAFASLDSDAASVDLLEGEDAGPDLPSAGGIVGPSASNAVTSAGTSGALVAGRIAGDILPCIGQGEPLDGFCTIAGVDTTVRGVVKYDTLRVKLDASSIGADKDSLSIVFIRGRKVFSGGAEEFYSIADADGDGIVVGRREFNGKAVLESRRIEIGGAIESTRHVAGSGPDRLFGDENKPELAAFAEDNVVLEASWKRMRGEDTLAAVTWSDADADGAVLVKSKPSLIRVERVAKRSLAHPFIERRVVRHVVRVLPGGDSRTVELSAHVKYLSGRTESVRVVDQAGDAVIEGDRIVVVRYETDGRLSQSDSTVSGALAITLDVGESFDGGGDDRIVSIHGERVYRLGPVATRVVDFVADESVPAGEEPRNGTIEFHATYRDGRSASLVGRLDDGVLNATWTGPDGQIVEIRAPRR